MRSTALFILCALASGAFAQQDPPQWSAGANVIGGGLFRGSDGNYYRALKTAMGHDPTTDNHVYWELYYVRSATTLQVGVGKRFTSFKTAWAFASSAHIVAPASVNISISTAGGAFSESFASAFSLNQENGDMITITGDNAAMITFTFPSNSSGLQITNGHRLGGLNGVTISCTSAGSNGSGLTVSDHSYLGPSALHIKNCFVCVSVLRSSQLDCSGSAFSSYTGQALDVELSSDAQAENTQIDGGSSALDGFYTSLNGSIDAIGSTVQNVKRYGFFASLGATILADQSTSKNNSFGFVASGRGNISAKLSTCTGNTTYGYYATGNSFIRTIGSSVSGNTTDYVPSLNTLGADGSIVTG